MSITLPFELLQALDSRWHANSSGMPVSKPVVDDWVGIGFRITGIPLVAKMDDVAEILPLPKTIRVPGVKFWVSGLANIRGSLMPVLDMNAFFSGSAANIGKQSRMLIINKKGLSAGLQVEEVYGLRRFKLEELSSETGDGLGSIGDYLSGMFVDQGHQWNVFSIDKLIKAEEFFRVV